MISSQTKVVWKPIGSSAQTKKIETSFTLCAASLGARMKGEKAGKGDICCQSESEPSNPGVLFKQRPDGAKAKPQIKT